MHTMSGWGNLREGDNWEGLGVDGRIILEWSAKDHLERRGLDCSDSREGQVAGACEFGN